MHRITTGLRWGAGSLLFVAGLAGLVTACNEHPVSYTRAPAAIEIIQSTSVDGAAKLDMLWVVDNSGSMCQEQQILRNNFDSFIEKLNETNLNFHIGVTTTDMNEDYPVEPVANPGRLQATPQPLPTFNSSNGCHNALDANGEIIEGDFTPIRQAMLAAANCLADPSSYRFYDNGELNVSNADIECALYNRPGCTVSGSSCVGGERMNGCKAEDLFPDPSGYRQIPLVLRSDDYRSEAGDLDIPRLKADFACMSFVGTRGYGIEKGLAAAVKATDPEMTGGTVESPQNDAAPNHGLIRSDARFAIVFVTDENDCSHNGNLKENTNCGGDVCEFASAGEVPAEFLVDPNGDPDPLLSVEDIKGQLIENLSATKGREVGESELLVASIHGIARDFTGEIPTNAACGSDSYSPVSPTCATQNGVAFSGIRYQEFLKSFPEGQYFPHEDLGEGELFGWMCAPDGDFSPALELIGDFFTTVGTGCVTRPILPCDGDDASCPAFPYTGEPGSCLPRPNSENEFYCDSGIQLRARVLDDSVDAQQRLTDSGYCVPESIGDPEFPDGCVISRDHYQWVDCPGVSGLRVQWNNEIEAKDRLLGMQVQIRYNSQKSEE